MAVYKIFPSADATVYSAYPAKNTGRDPVLEVSVKNSQDQQRYVDRSVAEQSPYFNYDLNVDDNASALLTGSADIRRSLLQFSNEDIQIIQTFASQSVSGSWQAALKANLAFAQNLSLPYTIEAYAVSQSWDMGTGMYANIPESRNGVSWNYTGPYAASNLWSGSYGLNILWQNVTNLWHLISQIWNNNPPALPNGGGSWYSYYAASQSFDYMSNKDINMNVTNIVDAWFSGSIANYGIVLKHPFSVEENSGSFIDLKFFSVDTHTIYPPCIELRWDDSQYSPVGSNYVTNNQFTVTLGNNPGTFKQGSIYKFRTSVRDTYPTRQFTTSSIYLEAKYLSENSYWAIQDLKTNEMIVDFDTQYTKLSADGTSNYFTVYMNGLEPERFYRILIKTIVPSADEMVIDNNLTFKVIR